MTKPDFAELKSKLCEFDSSETRDYAEGVDTIQKQGATYTFRDGAYYQHTKSSAIISELIEIIQSQSEALELYEELVWNIHPAQESERYAAKTCLSETTTRLQKLRDGK